MKKIKVDFQDIGLGLVNHSLMCWVCEKNPAVYAATKTVFKPCWECQERLGMIERKKWWQFWK